MIQWHFYEKVYRRWVVLMIGPIDEFKKELKSSGFKEMDTIVNGNGMCIELVPSNNTANQNCTIIWMPEYSTSTLVHEIVHLVMMCFDQTEVPISKENTESFAFYSEFWFTEIQKARRKHKSGRTPTEARL